MYEADQTTLEMANFPIEGNIIDHTWYHIIKNESGLTDSNAILLLSDIVYWYRPKIEIDSKTSKPKLYKKYKSDLLQRSYADIEKQFGFSKRQSQEAFKTLESLDIAHRELRTIEVNGTKIANVLFIKFNFKKLLYLREEFYKSTLELKKCIPSYENCHDPMTKLSQPHDKNVMTNTESSSKTSPKNTSSSTQSPSSSNESNPKFSIDDAGSFEKRSKNNISPPEIKFSDHDREQLNNYTPEQIAQAIEITNRDCIQRANPTRVKFFFKVLQNLQAKPVNKPKQTPYEILSKQFKDGKKYNGYTCLIGKDAICFFTGCYSHFECKFDKFFSWDAFDKFCKEKRIAYIRE